MKKFAIGCGIALLLCVIALGGVLTYGYYKLRPYAESVRQFAQIGELDKRVANKTPFMAPANGELTDDGMRRFVAVQESMVAKLGKRVQELNEKANELNRRQQEEHRQASASEALTFVTDMMGLLLQAKTAQVEALNASHFSLEEYDWVRRHVYAAAGMSITQFDVDKLKDAMKNGGVNVDIPKEATSEDVPPRNKQLVQPYLPKLKDWAPLAAFGL
jgi:hypothetical protein